MPDLVKADLLRRIDTTSPDDASVAYRVATAGCVVVSVLAAVLQQAVSPGLGFAAVLLVPVGFVFSYTRRAHRNVALKLVLTAGLFLAFAAFLSGVRGATSVDDTRAPLVAVFLWVQVMHSFDVPRARDLTFSVAASVVLIALAGSLAFSSGFLAFVLLHAVLLITSLVLAYRAELRRPAEGGAVASRAVDADAAPASRPARRNRLARRAAGLTAITMVATSVVFVFLPRFPATQLASLPFSLGSAKPISGFTGEVAVPGEGGRSDVGSSEAFDPDHYFGYGESMNLRARGTLSNELVMRVRTPRPTLYRAQGFDLYQDGRWSSTDTDLEELQYGGLDSIAVPAPPEGVAPGREVVQTFYVERELPNIVFHAYRPREVYVASTRLRMDDFTSIRTAYTMEKDTIYSVVSEVPDRDVERLRFAPPVDPQAPGVDRYLQIPDSIPQRFHDLSEEITRNAASPAEKAEAIQTWLKENKTYRLDISRDPPGRDPVDVFTFERQDGFCEQIAATMALMLRANGVPTRIVTGFGEGERNLFTGYWEVRNSDAHAWVEVFYPGAGWVPYDPTFGVPIASAANTTFMLAPFSKIATAVPAAIGAAGRGVRTAVGVLPGPTGAGAAVLVLLLGATIVLLVRRSRTRRVVARGRAARIVDGWLALERALATHGLRRDASETAQEFATRVAPHVDVDIVGLASTFGAARYGSASDLDVDAWEAQTTSAVAAIRRTKVGVS